MYNLVTNGSADLARTTQLFSIQKVARDPLNGVVDGSNTIFFASRPPILSSGSLNVQVGGSFLSGNQYTVQYDTGEFDLVSAPSQTPYGWYTTMSMPMDRQLRVMFAGFDEMERRWPRNFRLSSSLSNYVQASETDSNIYVVGPSDLSDPVAPSQNGIGWSQLRSQVSLFMECCRLAYFLSKFGEEAEVSLDYRENSGMSVRTSHRPIALDKVVDRCEKRVTQALTVAQLGWDTGLIGDVVLNPQSLFYRVDLDWQTDAREQDFRNVSL